MNTAQENMTIPFVMKNDIIISPWSTPRFNIFSFRHISVQFTVFYTYLLIMNIAICKSLLAAVLLSLIQ